jgi:hypothetical protein
MKRDAANVDIAAKDREQRAIANMVDYNAKLYAANTSFKASTLSTQAKAMTDVYSAQGRLLGTAIQAIGNVLGKVI